MFGLTPYRRNHNLQGRDRDIFDLPSILNNFFDPSVFSSFEFGENQMKVDIREDDKAYLLEAELPGIDKKEINVELNDGRLTISVDRQELLQDERDNYIRRERKVCSMRRSFYFDDIDDKDIKAKFDNGILKIRLAKLGDGKRKKKQIEIN